MLRRAITVAAIVTGLVGASFGSAGATHEYRYEPITTKIYLNNDGGGCPGTPYLSLTAGSGEPGCGFVGGAPFGELYHNGVWPSSTIKTYTTRTEGVPQYLDPTRDVEGNVRVVATATTNRMAVGQIRVDVTLRAVTETGQSLVLGTDSNETIVDPTNSAAVDFPFTMTLDEELDKVRLDQITMNVDIRGFHVLTGYQRLNGYSWFDLPAYERIPIPHEA